MKNFEFHVPTKILFGKNQVDNLATEVKQHTDRVLLVYGGGSIKKTGLYDKVVQQLKENNIFFKELSGVQPNPRISSVRDGVTLCKEHNLYMVLAVGGGSTIDCAKCIAAGATYDGDAWDFMIGKAKVENPIAVASILTLSATGTEMNANAVISNDETTDKLPMADTQLIPKFSILDPTLTYTVNKKHTAAGTADIMSHIFEQYFSNEKGTDVQDRISESLLKVCIDNASVAIENPENYDARANLMWASTWALNSLISTGKDGDWATHMIEHEVSAIYDITHGVGLAIITPNWMKHVLTEENAWKFATYARNVWNVTETDEMKAALTGIEKTKEFFTSIGMPTTLTQEGIDYKNIRTMAKKATRWGDLGFFKKLTTDDVEEILTACL